ncbi:MAG: YraN family protein [bacterium]|nr:YraN family protein [bacterium]
MPSALQKKGTDGEHIALRYLESLGYRCLNQQWHCRYGELDLIMLDQGELVFVEVKMRESNRIAHPEDMINAQKRSRLSKTALSYIQKNRLEEHFWRFDTVAITGNRLHYDLEHFRDTIREE